MTLTSQPAAVFFDLDGTLIDTAPDMVGAANALRDEHDLPPLAFASLRDRVSHGSTGLVSGAFGTTADEPRHADLVTRFLELYEQRLCQGTRLFEHGDTLLSTIEQAGIPWGIVTNKPGWLTEPLLKALGLTCRAACVISGDTLTVRKPHPEPLLEAARRCAVEPNECIYVGDAERDIEAGNAAGMLTLVATFGYIGANESTTAWGADASVSSLSEVTPWLSGWERASRPDAG